MLLFLQWGSHLCCFPRIRLIVINLGDQQRASGARVTEVALAFLSDLMLVRAVNIECLVPV